MTHKTAKLILEQAETIIDKENAIRSAIQLGMPLNEIEEYLDWLEVLRRTNAKPLVTKNNDQMNNPTGHSSRD
ncbi:MAG: hypothetical protein ACOVLE_06075 [Pirellula staleyi]